MKIQNCQEWIFGSIPVMFFFQEYDKWTCWYFICVLKPRSQPNCEQVRSVEIWTLQDRNNRNKFRDYLSDRIWCGHICWWAYRITAIQQLLKTAKVLRRSWINYLQAYKSPMTIWDACFSRDLLTLYVTCSETVKDSRKTLCDRLRFPENTCWKPS